MSSGEKRTTVSDPDEAPNRREQLADDREREADRREHAIDVRERALDRWEELLAARAAELGVLDETDVRDSPPGVMIAQLAAELQTARELDETAHRILDVALEVIAGPEAATIVLDINGRLSTAAATAEWAARADGIQVAAGAGPLIDALEHGPVIADDLTADDRWPALQGQRGGTTARGALSYGLAVGGRDTGAITFYSRAAGGFGAAAERVGGILAVHASVALERVLERLMFEARADAWQHALASRDVIGQAKGILMQQHGIDGDEAFRDLRETSQRLNRKVRDIAEHLVAHRTLPTD